MIIIKLIIVYKVKHFPVLSATGVSLCRAGLRMNLEFLLAELPTGYAGYDPLKTSYDISSTPEASYVFHIFIGKEGILAQHKLSPGFWAGIPREVCTQQRS